MAKKEEQPTLPDVEVLPKEVGGATTSPPNPFAISTTVPGFMTHVEVISQLRAKYHGKQYDVTTTAGMADAVAARRELREARIALDKAKPIVKKEALDFCAKVEADYKAVRAAVVEYEDIPDAAIKAEEQRKEREKEEERLKEEARRGAILESLNRITSIPVVAVSLTAAETMELIEKTRTIPLIAEEMQEFLSKAHAVKTDAVNKLIEMHAAKVQQEGEAARLEEERQRQAEEQRVQQEKLAELQRLADIEREKVRKEQESEAERLRAEREAFEKECADARRIAEEKEAAARMERAAEEKRLAEQRAEIERQQAELAEAERIAQAKRDEEAAGLKDPLEALKAIYAITQEPGIVSTLAIGRIAAIAKKFTEEG